MPTLLLQLKNKILGEYSLQTGASLTIGRRDTNDVVIEDQAVSGHHAKIDAMDERWVLIDLQSKNGSFVNEQLVNSHWLKHEDVITIGEHHLIFNHHEQKPIVKDDHIRFVVQPQAPHVHVRRSDKAKCIVDQQCLGVHERGLPLEDADAVNEQFVVKRAAGQSRIDVIVIERHDESDVDAA